MKPAKTAKLCILAFVGLFIWIMNLRILLLKDRMCPDLGQNNSGRKADPLLAMVNDFDFKPLDRDPFNAFSETTDSIPVMPIFSLRGVVLSAKTPVALIELSNGSVCPLKKGERFYGIKIKRITAKHVIAEFCGREEVFSIVQ